MAVDAYQRQTAHIAEERRAAEADRVVVMVVQPGEFNTFDQRHIEYTLLANHNVETVRLSLAEIAVHGRRTEDDCLLITLPNARTVEAAVVYYRSGYTPADYPSEQEWQARLMAELSHAIKCPNAAWHLAGTKKIQQVRGGDESLSSFSAPQLIVCMLPSFSSSASVVGGAALTIHFLPPACPLIFLCFPLFRRHHFFPMQLLTVPGVVEKFLVASDAELVRSTFTGMYSMDSSEYPDGEEGLQRVLDNLYANPAVRPFVLAF